MGAAPIIQAKKLRTWFAGAIILNLMVPTQVQAKSWSWKETDKSLLDYIENDFVVAGVATFMYPGTGGEQRFGFSGGFDSPGHFTGSGALASYRTGVYVYVLRKGNVLVKCLERDAGGNNCYVAGN